MENRQTLITAKFKDIQEILFKSGLQIKEIFQILNALKEILDSQVVGEVKPEEIK